MNALLDAALEYAGKGRRVVPLHHVDEDRRCSCGGCKTPGKHPRVGDSWQHKATTDEAAIRRWWKMFPDANVGYLTGAGIGVLDVDPRHGGAKDLAELEKQHGKLPETAEVATGGGGRHLFFKIPDGTRTRDLTEDGGLELKAEGAFVVAAPSIHATGKQYVWTDRCVPAEAPSWLLAEASGRQNGAAPPIGEQIPAGGRNKQLASMAGTMRRRNAAEPEILAALLEMNTNRCKPPLDDAEVRKVAQSVSRYEPESGPDEANGSDFASLSPNGDIPTRERDGRHVALTSSSAIRSERVRWLWSGRVPLRGLTVVPGEKGLGKSILTNAWLAAKLTRGELEGEVEGRPVDVLVATAEDDWASVIKPRLMAHGADLERVHRIEVFDESGNQSLLTLPDDVRLLEQEIQKLRDAGRTIGMIVIDPIGAFLADKTDSHKDAPVRRALAPLAALAERLDLAAVVVAHLTKDDTKKLISRVSGAGAFVNAARSVLAFARDPGDPNGEQGRERVLVHVGTNWGCYAPSLGARIESRLVDVDDGSRADVGYLVITGETDVGVDDLQRGADEDGADCEEFIGAALVEGPRPSREVKATVIEQLKVSRRTVERHAARMEERGELIVSSGGFPRTTTWALDSGATAVATPLDARSVVTGESGATEPSSPPTTDSGDIVASLLDGGATESPNGGAPVGPAPEKWIKKHLAADA